MRISSQDLRQALTISENGDLEIKMSISQLSFIRTDFQRMSSTSKCNTLEGVGIRYDEAGCQGHIGS
jgi:hypothetical protein